MRTRLHKTFRVAAVCLGFSFLISQPVDAALIATDTSFGADTATLDTASNREWLDLSLTRPFSLNFVLSQLGPAGMFAGFQVATSSDVTALVNNSGLLTAGPGPAAFDAFNVALNLFDGVVHDLGGLGCTLAVYGVHSGAGSNVIGFLNDRFSMGSCDLTGSTSFNVINSAGGLAWAPGDPIVLSDSASPPIRLSGVWLFRDATVIPAPGTISLIALGLVVLATLSIRRGQRPIPTQR